MTLQIWCFREMPLQFPNFEKCHFMPFLVAFFDVWSGVFKSLQIAVAFFKVCKNCSGIFQSLEIAVAFLWIAIIGVAFIYFFETEAGCQLGCAGHSVLSRQPFLLCLPQDQPSSFFLSENGLPNFFVLCQVSRFVRPIGMQIFQDKESFIRLAQKTAYQ